MEFLKRRKRATGVIVRDGEVLLFRRVKAGREYYAFPGGNVEKDESVEEGLVREIKEELGLVVEEFEQFCIIENVWIPSFAGVHKDRCDYACFLVTKWSGVPELGRPEKERSGPENQYHIEWTPLLELGCIGDVYPEALVSKLI